MSTVPAPKVDVVKRKSGLGFTANDPVWDFDCRECKANGYVVADAIKLEPVSTQTVSGLYFIHNDHLGTPKLLTDSSGTVVWQQHTTPFGEITDTLATGINNLKSFPGQYRDGETGYSYNYFRDYDPSLGRYVQSDPIGLNGGLNTYGYVRGNPISAFDPQGLHSIESDKFTSPVIYSLGLTGFMLVCSVSDCSALIGYMSVRGDSTSDETDDSSDEYCLPYLGPGSDDECKRLKNNICKNIPVLKKGNQILKNFTNLKKVKHLTFSEINLRKKAINQCLEARKNVTNRCFRVITDPRHADQEAELKNALIKMDELINLLEKNGLGR